MSVEDGAPCGAQQTCSAGTCAPWVCTPGALDCADAATARACNADGLGYTTTACAAGANATASCASGACSLACAAGYGNCDGNAANGCEAALASDLANGGACGLACRGVEVCTAGACLGTCPAGQQSCSGVCATTGGACTTGLAACAQSGTYQCGNNTARQVAIGGSLACALLEDGRVRCWGQNNYGQLGIGVIGGAARTSPAGSVALAARATSISAGDNHACARLVDGRVQCWGYKVNGQLGNGSATNTGTPVFVSGLATARSARAGVLFTCAILADTTVRCWGYNSDGQLGDGTSTTRTAPVPVSGLTGAAEIAAGSGHSCARLADGTARCWGKNDHGQLGDGTTVGPRRTPVVAPGLTGLRSLSVATLTSCVVLADTSVSCWGYNALGLVGDGTTTDRPAPTPMVNLPGGLVCGAVAGAPGVETCNGADDDCDGIVDNVASMTCP